jgi:1-acyl-sn-glycerol-3-phosphate acyltransferase
MVAALYAPDTLLGRLLAGLETISIKKSGQDLGAIKAAIGYARRGELVGMMPEGNVNKSEQFMMPVRPGAIVVALSAGVPVVPCYIEDAPYHPVPWRPLFKFARVKVRVGQAIDLSMHYGKQGDAKLVAEIAVECIRQIAVLAGNQEFEPQIAGRAWKDWNQAADPA